MRSFDVKEARPGKVKKNFTEQQINRALEIHKGNMYAAARYLGVARSTFFDWMKDKKFRAAIPMEEIWPKSTLKLKQKKRQRFVITCSQNNTMLDQNFINSLRRYCEHNNAQLVVIPTRYKNVTAYITDKDYEVWWPEELTPYYLNTTFMANKNVAIMGDFKIGATAASPLSGVDAVPGQCSAVFGHAQIQLKMIPTPSSELPRQMLTTGSCSVKNYSSSKTGTKASFHHSYGATLLEVDGDLFFTRQLNATEDGCFYDLDTYYQPDTPPLVGFNAAGLVCGDYHDEFLDPGVKAATFGNGGSIYNIAKPDNVYLHDFTDFYSANHHHKNNFFTRYAKHISGMGNVEREMDHCVHTINELLNNCGSVFHIIASNHNNAFLRWLNDANPKDDPENALLYHKMMVLMLERIKMTEKGAEAPDPVQLYIASRASHPERLLFHSRNSRVQLHGVELSQHGDRGPNGARGSLLSFSKSGYKTVTGHSHTPGIEKGAYAVGTSSRLQLEYNDGFSSWMHTHCLIYPNGKRSLINIINGQWRLVMESDLKRAA
jgi:hypothetical protein